MTCPVKKGQSNDNRQRTPRACQSKGVKPPLCALGRDSTSSRRVRTHAIGKKGRLQLCPDGMLLAQRGPSEVSGREESSVVVRGAYLVVFWSICSLWGVGTRVREALRQNYGHLRPTVKKDLVQNPGHLLRTAANLLPSLTYTVSLLSLLTPRTGSWIGCGQKPIFMYGLPTAHLCARFFMQTGNQKPGKC